MGRKTTRKSRRSIKPAPELKRHKRSGNAYARFNGRQVWFGPFDEQASHAEFAAFVAQWEADGRKLLPDKPAEDMTVRDLVARFLEWAEVYYRRKDGTDTGETRNCAYAARELLRLYGPEHAVEFNLRKLKRIRHLLVEQGLCRTTVNARIGRIKRIYSWAADEELVPSEVSGGLQALKPFKPFKPGRSKAEEPAEKHVATWAEIKAVIPHLLPTVRTMLLLQWWTGMRPGEVVDFRLEDLDTRERVIDGRPTWAYRPRHHKTAHKERPKTIGIGRKGQSLLMPYLRREGIVPGEPLFRPVDAVAERRLRDRAARRTPLWEAHKNAQAAKRKETPQRAPGTTYSVAAYWTALFRACTKARVPQFPPNAIRHAYAQRIEEEENLDAASATLGHSSRSTTLIYARIGERKALAAAAKYG